MAAAESDFTGVSETSGGGDVKDQWPKLARAIQSLVPFFLGKISNGTEPTDVLTGIAFGTDGQTTTHLDWRIFLNSSDDLVFQENTGSEGTPTWTTRMTINSSGFDASSVDHDALLNFVANEHIDHTSVTLTAGEGLSGGGDISANRSFALSLTELSTATPAAADLLIFEDVTDNSNKKATITNIEAALPNVALLNTEQEFTATQGSTEQTPSSSANAITLDFTGGNAHEVTLTENITSITITNTSSTPATHVLKITQDSTPRTVTGWPAAVKWVSGTAPTISTGSGAVDIISFYADSSGNIYGSVAQDFS